MLAGLDDRPAAVFDEVGRHGELTSLVGGADLAREVGADALISVGGGAAIDSAKFIAVLLAREGSSPSTRFPTPATG